MVMERGPAPASRPDVYRCIADLHALKRLGKPDEIMEAGAWLCSELASFATGHTLVVDGGLATGLESIHERLRRMAP